MRIKGMKVDSRIRHVETAIAPFVTCMMVVCSSLFGCTLMVDFSEPGIADGSVSADADPDDGDGAVWQDADPDDDGGNLPICGNDIAEEGEVCDGTDLREETCESQGFDSGDLSCFPDCSGFDTSGCWKCGDSIISGPEKCDGDDLGGETCDTQGFIGGTLLCREDCLDFDTSRCWTCGDGRCDLDLGESFDACPEDCGVKDISAGYAHVCAVRNDGTVWCWGFNDKGQLGDGTQENRSVPVRVNGLEDVKMVSSGHKFTCAVKNDGTAWCWGHNLHGQLGIDTMTEEPDNITPIQVQGLDEVDVISAGGNHTCAVKNDGTLWCWGFNDRGQLGIGTYGDDAEALLPQHVPDLNSVLSISAGKRHTCAVDGDGDLYCWGANWSGQLGTGAAWDAVVASPAHVPQAGSTLSVSSATGHTCSINIAGSFLCWGVNDYGTLGNGSTLEPNVPEPVMDPPGRGILISAGPYHTCAIDNDESPWCWGNNMWGQLGQGSDGPEISREPLQVTILDPVKLFAVGGYFTCAVDESDFPWCWGENNHGQLGNGLVGEDGHEPMEVSWE